MSKRSNTAFTQNGDSSDEFEAPSSNQKNIKPKETSHKHSESGTSKLNIRF